MAKEDGLAILNEVNDLLSKVNENQSITTFQIPDGTIYGVNEKTGDVVSVEIKWKDETRTRTEMIVLIADMANQLITILQGIN